MLNTEYDASDVNRFSAIMRKRFWDSCTNADMEEDERSGEKLNRIVHLSSKSTPYRIIIHRLVTSVIKLPIFITSKKFDLYYRVMQLEIGLGDQSYLEIVGLF